MTDLNVSLIAKYIDRLSGPAKKSVQVLMGLATAQKASGKASAEAAKNTTVLTQATDNAAKGQAVLAAAITGAGKGAQGAGKASAEAARSTGALSRAAADSVKEQAFLAHAFNDAARGAGGAGKVSADAAKSTTVLAQATAAAARGEAALSRASSAVAKAVHGVGKASADAAKTTATLSRAAAEAIKEQAFLTAAYNDGAKAALGAGEAQTGLGESTNNAGNAANTAYRKFSLLEKAQFRARAGARMLGSQMDELQGKLAKLGMASIAINTLAQGGGAIMRPISGSISRQADFERRMTGIGILGDLDQGQIATVRSNIFKNAGDLGLPVDTVQQDDMAVLNEGVYRNAGDLNVASRAAAKISLLGDITDSPVTGSEAGALISTYAHTLSLPAQQIDAFNAMLFRASQLGGDRIGDVARFMPTVMAQMKGNDFGNKKGFIDVLAAFQIIKRVAGDDEQAGTDLRDLMANLNHRLTRRRFAKEGINLDKVIYAAEKKGVSPLEAVMDALRPVVARKVKKEHRTAASVLGEFFQNQWAGQAALAMMQYKDDGSQGLGFDHMRRMIADPSAQTSYDAGVDQARSGPRAKIQSYEVAKDQLAVSTGTILQPGMEVAAKGAGLLANAMTALEQHGGLLGKAAVWGATGVGLLTVGVAKAGQATVGLLATSLIVKEVFGKSLPVIFKTAGASIISFGLRALPVMWGFTAALLANPITWIVAGVIALAAAAFLVWKNWKPISKWFGDFWTALKADIDKVASAVRNFFSFKAPSWLGALGAVAALGLPGGPAIAAALVAARASHPAAQTAPHAPAAHTPAAPGKPAVTQLTLYQTFHVNGGNHDTKTLAEHMAALSDAHARSALHDEAN